MDTYTKRERTIYLLGMLGQNLIYGVIGTGLTYYFQSVIFLPALAISTITLLSKIAEFLCDPYVGMRIDRSHNTKGKCRTYLIFSPLPIFIFSLLCFLIVHIRQQKHPPPAWVSYWLPGLVSSALAFAFASAT